MVGSIASAGLCEIATSAQQNLALGCLQLTVEPGGGAPRRKLDGTAEPGKAGFRSKMTLHRLSATLRALTLGAMILLAAPTSALAPLLYFCSMTGAVGPKCCCNHAQAPDPHEPAAGSIGCCAALNNSAAGAAHLLRDSAPSLDLPLIEAQPRPLTLRPAARLDRRAPARLGARSPPPDTALFKVHCTYLI